ncbi:MAG: alpha/beta hydrolase [bacterium]
MSDAAGAGDVRARNNVKVTGRGTQPMLFAHGFGCDQHMWRFVAPAFEPDYRVVTFDYVGASDSNRGAYDAERYATLDGYAQDVLDVCAALDLHDVVFVAHSVSGMVGVLAANREPARFAQLVMLGPSARYVNDTASGYVGGFEQEELRGLLDMMERNYIGWANFLAPVVMKNGERPELGTELEASFCSTDPVIARQFAEATFFADNRADVHSVSVPSLIVQSADDAIAPQSVGEYLRDAMPHSTYRLLDVTGHCPHMSHPEQTIAAIRDYLGAARPSGADD